MLALVAALAPPGTTQWKRPEKRNPWKPATDAASTPAYDVVPSLEVRALANEGFLLRAGDDVVAIDAFVGAPYSIYGWLPEDVVERLHDRSGEFASLDLALASHVHGDHFQAEVAREWLSRDPTGLFASSPQVLEALWAEAAAHGDEALRARTRSVLPDTEGTLTLEVGDIRVDVLRLSHGTGRFADIQNLGHVITLGGMSALHVGDAAMVPANFATYELAERDLDVVFVPYWYFGDANGRRIIDEHFRPAQLVACHIPPDDVADVVAEFAWEHPDVLVPQTPLERFEIAARTNPMDAAYDAQPADAASDEGSADFLDWAAETLIPVDLGLVDRGLVDSGDGGLDAGTLDQLLDGKRFVFLGEPDHFVHEKYAFRLLFIRQLVDRGWRHIGMEMGHADGLRVDRYLQTGDLPTLEQVGLYGLRDSLAQEHGIRGFLDAEFAFADALRQLSMADDARPLRYFGYDLDMVPGSGSLDIEARLADVPEAAPWLDRLREAREQDLDERVPALEALADELASDGHPVHGALASGALEAVRLDLLALIESYRFQLRSMKSEAIGYDDFARREETMFTLFDAYVDGLDADEPVILMGHDLHLGRRWQGAGFEELTGDLAYGLWPTIGAHVTERFGDEVFVIWMLYDHGQHVDAFPPMSVEPVESVEGTVEHLLARLPAETFLLPLGGDDPRAQWLDRTRDFRVNGERGYGNLRAMADAILFVREVSEPRGR